MELQRKCSMCIALIMQYVKQKLIVLQNEEGQEYLALQTWQVSIYSEVQERLLVGDEKKHSLFRCQEDPSKKILLCATLTLPRWKWWVKLNFCLKHCNSIILCLNKDVLVILKNLRLIPKLPMYHKINYQKEVVFWLVFFLQTPIL